MNRHASLHLFCRNGAIKTGLETVTVADIFQSTTFCPFDVSRDKCTVVRDSIIATVILCHGIILCSRGKISRIYRSIIDVLRSRSTAKMSAMQTHAPAHNSLMQRWYRTVPAPDSYYLSAVRSLDVYLHFMWPIRCGVVKMALIMFGATLVLIEKIIGYMTLRSVQTIILILYVLLDNRTISI